MPRCSPELVAVLVADDVAVVVLVSDDVLVPDDVAVVVLVSDDVAVEELVAVAVGDSVSNHNHTSQAAVTGLLSTSVLTSCDCKHLPELVAVAELELVDEPAHTREPAPPPTQEPCSGMHALT
jgi:hypothetical protein